MYFPRITGTDYIRTKNAEWEEAMMNRELHKLVQSWFPDAVVNEFQSENERKCKASWELWNKYEFEVDIVYPKETVDRFKRELSVIWGMKQLNSMMKTFSHYECVKAGKGMKKRKFRSIESGSQ